MVIKIIATFILLSYLNNISFACSFNCGGTYTKNHEYGLKTTSHSGYKKHAFYYMPKNHYHKKFNHYLQNMDFKLLKEIIFTAAIYAKCH